MPKDKRSLPPLVIRRLPKYLAFVQELDAEAVEWVSSKALADQLGLTSSTVRQDFSHLDFSGTSKRGYAIPGLKRMLEQVLGVNQDWRVVVVGVGNLGRALALHEEFSRRGFNIRAVFDNDPRKEGKRVGKVDILPMSALPGVVASEGINIGIIAVPAAAAQRVADIMIASGIRGLLNLALTHIVAPKHVAVLDSRIVASLLELAHLLSAQMADD